MKDYTSLHCAIALMRDGFHPESPGGEVSLRPDGSAVVDYKLTPYIFEGIRRAYLSMSEIQFAAGAEVVLPNHLNADRYTSWAQAKEAIASFPMKPYVTRVGSAHVMGGSAMGSDPETSVTDPGGLLHTMDNISVFDGSLFPTSIGTNPTMSICALTYLLAGRLAEKLKAS
jgi:choline dehydrogenase-like flavoprotein